MTSNNSRESTRGCATARGALCHPVTWSSPSKNLMRVSLASLSATTSDIPKERRTTITHCSCLDVEPGAIGRSPRSAYGRPASPWSVDAHPRPRPTGKLSPNAGTVRHSGRVAPLRIPSGSPYSEVCRFGCSSRLRGREGRRRPFVSATLVRCERTRIPKAQNSACWWSISTTNVRLFCRRQADSLKRSSDKPTLRPASRWVASSTTCRSWRRIGWSFDSLGCQSGSRGHQSIGMMIRTGSSARPHR